MNATATTVQPLALGTLVQSKFDKNMQWYELPDRWFIMVGWAGWNVRRDVDGNSNRFEECPLGKGDTNYNTPDDCLAAINAYRGCK